MEEVLCRKSDWSDRALTLTEQHRSSKVVRLLPPFPLGKTPVEENKGNKTAEPSL